MKSVVSKNTLVGSVLAVIALSAAAQDTEKKDRAAVRFIGEVEYAGFCSAVIRDDISALEKNVTRYVGKLAGSREAVLARVIAEDGLRCNGDNLIVFAQRRGAHSVHNFLTARQEYQ